MTYAESDRRLPEQEIRRPRQSAVVRVISWLFGWSLILGLVGAAIGGWAWLNFTASGPLQQSRTILVEKGLSRSQISAILQENGVISDARIFSAASAANTIRGRYVKPGEYEFSPGSSMQEVMAQMLQGRVLTYKLTIPEGWTTEMALQRIRENDVLTGELTQVPAEGALLANTLVFQRGMTRQQFVDSLTTQQSALIDELWDQRPANLPLKSKEEMVTLASIVEKETGKAEERPAVAAVFLNRLRKGMRLQSDPTIIYGLVGGQGKLDRSLTRSDIDGVTPYNTYAIDGLPPGPIATPGRASLEAVIRPDSSEYLYFVADGTGGHAFAHTLDEHNANVAKWRRIENAPQEPEVVAPAPAPAPPVPAVNDDGLAAVPLDAPEQATEPLQPAAEAQQEAQLAEAAAPADETTSPAADDEPVLDLKPGSVIRVGEKLIPVPAPRTLKQ